MWNSKDFITHILCEINFEEYGSSKTAFFKQKFKDKIQSMFVKTAEFETLDSPVLISRKI